jgi:hypothetical protein
MPLHCSSVMPVQRSPRWVWLLCASQWTKDSQSVEEMSAPSREAVPYGPWRKQGEVREVRESWDREMGGAPHGEEGER